MQRIVLCAALAVATASNCVCAEDLTKVVIPDEATAARKTLKDWMTKRGFEVEERDGCLVTRRGGMLMSITPAVYERDLDRLTIVVFYHAKDEFKGKPEFVELVAKLNDSQTFLKVFVDKDGDLAILGNLTFCDDLSARYFDTYVDNYAQAIREFVLTDEALKMLD
jgi:hypothetical protein